MNLIWQAHRSWTTKPEPFPHRFPGQGIHVYPGKGHLAYFDVVSSWAVVW